MLRLGWVVWIWGAGAVPASDAAWYYGRALEMIAGAGYAIDGVPTAYWPVGYPAFLALLFTFFENSPLVGMIANVVLYLGAMAAAYVISRKLFGSETVARLTLLAMALWPNHIAYSSLLLSEPLFLFLMLWAVALLLAEPWKLVAAAGAGLLFGFAALVKPQALFLPFICGLTLLVMLGDRKRVWKLVGRLVLVHVAMLLVVYPWMHRNQRATGIRGILSTNDGINLLIGNNPWAAGRYSELNARLKLSLDNSNWYGSRKYGVEDRNVEGVMAEQYRNVSARDLALDYVYQSPLEALGRVPLKFWYLYRADTEGLSHTITSLPPAGASGTVRILGILKVVAEAFYLAICAMFLAYWFFRWRGGNVMRPASGMGIWIIGYFTLIPMIYFGDGRFHFPAIPWIAMYGATFIASLPVFRSKPGITGDGLQALQHT